MSSPASLSPAVQASRASHGLDPSGPTGVESTTPGVPSATWVALGLDMRDKNIVVIGDGQKI
ncbi:hypothetical protein PC120_g23253 [Phytophthora cactorum]|nr:hypothetical protein PC120_g23253 [Phytophthora cactorum]